MNRYSKFIWTTTPLLLVLVFLILYIVFDAYFIRGSTTDKTNNSGTNSTSNKAGLDVNMISRVETAENQNTSSNRLTNIHNEINGFANASNAKTKEIAKIQSNIAEDQRKIDCLKIAAAYANQKVSLPADLNCAAATTEANPNGDANVQTTNANPGAAINANLLLHESRKTLATGELNAVQTNVNGLAAEIKKNEDAALAIRRQYSSRYSNRILWTFFTALFVALTIAATITGAYAIFKAKRLFIDLKPEADRPKAVKAADRSTVKWIAMTGAAAAALMAFLAVNREAFMAVALPLMRQSIIKENVDELSAPTLIFFAVIGFVGSNFLVSASCVIFRTAVEVDDNVPPKPSVEPAESNTSSAANDAPETVEDADLKLKLYAELLKYLRMILYVGTFMLFVGILRMSYMMKWHLAFISTNATNDLYMLLNNFWDTMMTVQGGFYTILLAAIYLPAAFWINEKISQLGKTPADLTAEGVSVNFTDVLIKLLAIVSPLIASGFGSGKDWLSFLGN